MQSFRKNMAYTDFTNMRSQLSMNILRRYVIRLLVPSFFVSFLLFTFFVEILDISVNLIRYLLNEVPIDVIIQIQLLYLPTSIVFALPVAVLFATSLTMSNLYANNELIAVYSAGISLFQFVVPLIVIGILLSVGNFYFKEKIEIDSVRKKAELVRKSLNQDLGKSNVDVSLLDNGGETIYHAVFYNDVSKILSSVSIIQSDEEGDLLFRMDAQSARWNGTQWVFDTVKMYEYDKIMKKVSLKNESTFTSEKFNAQPERFESVTDNIDEMQYSEALSYIEELKQNGLPYRKLLAETYARIPLAISPFIVMLIACFAANAYGKNTFLMSLLISLISAVVYYSSELMGSVLASRLIIPPLLGAWLSVIITVTLSVGLYKFATK